MQQLSVTGVARIPIFSSCPIKGLVMTNTVLYDWSRTRVSEGPSAPLGTCFTIKICREGILGVPPQAEAQLVTTPALDFYPQKGLPGFVLV